MKAYHGKRRRPQCRIDGRTCWVRMQSGTWRPVSRLLGDGDGNTKLRKNKGRGFATSGLSLAPADSAGFGNTCPHASPGCKAACLDHQGLASVWQSIQDARVAKTLAWYGAREWFLETLSRELAAAVRKADRECLDLAVRLNVFSDVAWEEFGIVGEFPQIQFYDYSKNPRRAGLVAPNYWLTFSRSETNELDARRLLAAGHNVSVVFGSGRMGRQVSGKAAAADLPKTWRGFPVVDGDISDLRFQDPRGRTRGRVIGLRLKAHSWDEYHGALASGFAIGGRN